MPIDYSEDYDFSLDPSFNKKFYWKKLCLKFGYCSYCRPNKGENFGHGSKNTNPTESWKWHRPYQAKGRIKGEAW